MAGRRRETKAARRVRQDSRAAAAVKAVLECGDLASVPDCHLVDEGRIKAVVSLGGLTEWARNRGMDLRPHDAVELSRCLDTMGHLQQARGDLVQYGLPELRYARGLWSEATSWAHDFEDDGRCWTGDPAPTPEGCRG